MKTIAKTAVGLLTAVLGGALAGDVCAEQTWLAPVPELDSPKATGELQTAVLAGGCFWGVEGVYEHVRGVTRVVSGYAGGTRRDAKYDLVSGGGTRHAESVRIEFDPSELTYGEVLRIFFSVAHDPTQLNRQGPDRGKQYRSAIFYGDDQQRDIATRYVAQLDAAKLYPSAIVTVVNPLKAFYPAEPYHQDFIEKNPVDPYVVHNDLPKIRNLGQMFPDSYREQTTRN